ncbi:tetratricopeptide repeat protein [Veronia pacifica]|uniref:Uncharacterized protein n=1 Tax=Veronia pacifica TaxID=1080227 RepID=A0A1C3ELP1_9GAMM|nr:tetratricopeptide repeat protein [Veronia pacifica]ODA34149.1 hypothetical protein A8L45_07670 [Veronia pacifica]
MTRVRNTVFQPLTCVVTTVLAMGLVFSSPAYAAKAVSQTEQSAMSVEHVSLTPEELASVAYQRAQKSAQAGDMNRAISYLREVIEHQPTHTGAINQLAALLYGKNLGREAEQVLRRGIKANPHTLSLKLTLARLFEQSGQPEAALSVLLTEPSGNEKDSEQTIRFYAMRGALSQYLNKTSLAHKSYLWLTANDDDDGRWWLGLALAEEKSGRETAAIAAYESALEAGHLSSQSVSFVRTRLLALKTASEDQNGD